MRTMENRFFRRLHKDTEPDTFNALGINAFESTFRALFEQASSQSNRLCRISKIMSLLEDEIFRSEVLDDLNPTERVALFRDLADQSNTITRNLITLSKPFTNLRLIIATLDGLRRYKGQCELQNANSDAMDI